MGVVHTNADAESVTFSAIVTRADGTVEDHGVIAYTHKRFIWRLWFKLTGRAH